MPYRIAGIDVHKRMLAVVVSDVGIDGEYAFERREFGSNPAQLRLLAGWLLEQQVEEVVMESTAQYWKPVWAALERDWKPICQKREGAARCREHCIWRRRSRTAERRGRKNDFADAERLVKRLVAHELTLSFVPDAEQRLWRTVMRTKYQLTRNRVQLQNRLEALLEEAHIKLSSLVSDLLGVSARRMLQALAEGETDPAALAALADHRLRATPEQLRDALGPGQELHPVYRRLLKMALEELQSDRGADWPTGPRDGRLCSAPIRSRSSVWRRYPVWEWIRRSRSSPKWAPRQRPFLPPEISLPGWAHAPARRRAAGVNRSHRSPKGNRQMRRILNQAANAAVKHKGSIFEILYRRYVLRMGHNQTIGGDCPPALSPDLEDSPPRSSLRGTRPGGQQELEAGAHRQNDPATPKPRLPRSNCLFLNRLSQREGGFSTLRIARRQSLRLPH